MKAKKCRGMNMDDDSRSSVELERFRRVAMDKEGHMNKSLGNGEDKLNRDFEKMSSSTGVNREEVKQVVKVEAVAEAGDTRKVIIASADEERTEEERRRLVSAHVCGLKAISLPDKGWRWVDTP